MAYDRRPSKERFSNPHVVFEHELSKIKNPKAKQTVVAMLKVAPAEFWFAPSAFSGKYHSADEFGCGGQCLHTRRVFRSLMVNLDAMAKELNDDEMDVQLCAALIHDSLAGSTGGPDHVSHYWSYYESKLPKPIKELEWWEDIFEIASHHMGRWPPTAHKQLYPEWQLDGGECPAIEWLLHLADMQCTKANNMPILKEHDYQIRR